MTVSSAKLPAEVADVERRVRWVQRVFALGSAAVILLAVLTLSPTLTRASKNLLGYSSVSGKINEVLNPFRTRHALVQGGLPVYDLKIPAAEYREILEVVDAAKCRGQLTDDLKQWSDGRFIHEGHTRDVKLRIRGDFADHWQDQRRSWRIRFPKLDPLDGQREINLIVPTDGKAITQAFANAVFKRLGCITLRDRYVILRINGIPQGVYYQSEHFQAPMLAYNDRPETTVFRNPGGGRGAGSFREMITEGDPAAWQALDALLSYELDGSETKFTSARAVTDEDDYARFLAGVALFSADHTSQVTDNHRLYYDLSAGVFLRIPWDLEPQRIPKIERFDLADWHATFDVFARWPMSRFQIAMLHDDAFRLKRNQLLWELVRDDSLLDLFDEVYRDARFAFWADVMGKGDEEARLDRFRELIRHNMRLIRGSLSTNQSALTMRANKGGIAELEFTVDNTSGITVQAIELTGGAAGEFAIYRDSNGNGTWDAEDVLTGEAAHSDKVVSRIGGLRESLVPGTGVANDYPAYIYDPEGGGTPYRAKTLRTVIYPATRRHSYFLVHRKHESTSGWPSVRVCAVNAVTGESIAAESFPVQFLDDEFAFDASLRSRPIGEFLSDHSAFAMEPDSASEVVLGPDLVHLEGTIVVPSGYTLRIRAGTTLELGSKASLVSFSAIVAEGTPDSPIEIRGATSDPWGVVASVRPGAPCLFRHVRVQGGNTLAGTTVQGIYFTGALAIHHGDAVIESCEFYGNSAEDGLNVKHGRVRIRDCVFRDNGGDAVDLDWVTGEVTGCRFLHNAGDGLDLSGATVVIAGNRMESSGDKGISVGERSRPVIHDNVIVGNAIGVAVKDLSETTVQRCTLMDNKVSVTAFRKKPIFGGGRVLLRDCILLDTTRLSEVDAYSSVAFENCRGLGDAAATGVRPIPQSELAELRRTIRAVDADSTEISRTNRGTN